MASLTKHHNSIRDDYLNTHYYSHYNQEYGKVYPEDHNQTAIDYIEKQIEMLKERQEEIAPSRGINLDNLDEIKKKVFRTAQLEYEKFIANTKRDN